MTKDKISALVAEAVKLDRYIREGTERLKAIKERLTIEAESRIEEATDTEGGGKSLEFSGEDGCIARVTTAGATLKSSLKPSDKKFEKIKLTAGGVFTRLFETEVVHKPIEGFRSQAVELLGPKTGGALIKLCETPGRTTVSFETKESAAA